MEQKEQKEVKYIAQKKIGAGGVKQNLYFDRVFYEGIVGSWGCAKETIIFAR